MKSLLIDHLYSGGLITNYYCSAKCQHCLYASSPKWEKLYLENKFANKIFQKIKELGCNSIHIGGGEPLLNLEELLPILQTAFNNDIRIEYIETNSSWYKNEKSCVATLNKLKIQGINTLLTSLSPFHNEFIPYSKLIGVINGCKKAGIHVFPWISDFFPDIENFDKKTPHKLEEYINFYGKDYLIELAHRYNLTFGGRTLLTYKHIMPKRPLQEVLRDNNCREFENTSHFHIDLFGNYIPGKCSGLAIDFQDLGHPLCKDKYPILTILYNQGVQGLLNLAQKYGFKPEESYISKCHLCLSIRLFLVTKVKYPSGELKPLEFYYQL